LVRKIEFEFERGGKFVAELLEVEAPETCKYICDKLPITYRVRQSTISGETLGINLDGWDFKKLENSNTMVPPGELGFLTTHIPHTPETKLYCQILFAYGPNQIHQMWGRASPTNRFAKTVEGTVKELRDVATRIHEKGRENVTIKIK